MKSYVISSECVQYLPLRLLQPPEQRHDLLALRRDAVGLPHPVPCLGPYYDDLDAPARPEEPQDAGQGRGRQRVPVLYLVKGVRPRVARTGISPILRTISTTNSV